MTTGEHALEALQGLSRARQAVDTLWLDFRQTAPSQAQLDALVFAIVVEMVGVHDALEHVVECTLEGTVARLERITRNGGRTGVEGDDPQAMTVANWPRAEDDADG